MADLKRRAALCKVHGLHYDPSLTSGCIRCRKDGTRRTKPQFIPLLLILLALAAVGAVVLQGFFDWRRDRATIPEPPAPVISTSRSQIDPGPYREPLVGLEGTLFDDTTTNLEGLIDRIAGRAAELVAALRRNEHHRWAAAELGAFADAVSAEESTLQALAERRGAWLSLRQRIFAPAPWLIRKPPAGTNRLAASATLDRVAELQALVDEAQTVDAVAWQSFESGWRSRIAATRGRMPPPPPFDSDARLLVAQRELDAALADLDAIPTEVPSERRERLERIVVRLHASADQLADIIAGG